MIEGTVGNRPLQLFFLYGEQRRVLLDTGCAPDPERFVFPYLSKIGLRPRDIDLVITTHPDTDHCGGNAAIKRANPNVLLSCGESDRDLVEDPSVLWSRRYNAYAASHDICYGEEARRWNMEMLGSPQTVDFTWRGGEKIRLSADWLIEILHTPGHSPGHLSIYDPRSRAILFGDAVQGNVYLDTSGNPALCPTYLHVDPYLATVRLLRALQPETLAGCHWPVKRSKEIEAFLDETEQFVELAENVVLRLLAGCPSMTLRELIAVAGIELGDWPRDMDRELVYALAGHMDQLTARGVVQADSTVFPVKYRLLREARAKEA